ncbi:TPA: carbon storage regulator [bacterium]|nr:MAG: carbon storage regulator [Candidatus Hydrogenedentes bacterium CG1_02_42_14]PIU48842.1 MAG: carbon storage regulator [Candidatus Hydrogenedentes bacterium CG07_land_8_20_14_0_80_42_17]HBW47180.1 carbon storage regulator [bacterium]
MLVLARHLNESIIIGDDIEIVVVSVQHDQVKLGIKAPRNISVHRKEVYDEIQRENRLAADARGDLSKGAELLKQRFKDEKNQ